MHVSQNVVTLKCLAVEQNRVWDSGDTCSTYIVSVVSQFNGTSTPKVSYSAKTGDNDCNVNSSRYSLRTALCEVALVVFNVILGNPVHLLTCIDAKDHLCKNASAILTAVIRESAMVHGRLVI